MKTRIGGYVGGCMFLAALWILGVNFPAEQKRDELKEQSLASRMQLDDYKRTLKELPEFLERNKKLLQSRLDLNSALYAKSDILSLLEKLHTDADDFGLSILEITPPVSELLALNRTIESSNDPLFLNLTILMTGGYKSFGKYVARLESKSFFRGVNSCAIIGSTKANREVTYLIGFKAMLGGFGESL